MVLQRQEPLIYGIAVADRCNLACRGCLVSNTGRPESLRHADLGEADLGGVKPNNANLSFANLRRAKLRRANLEGADLSEAESVEVTIRPPRMGRFEGTLTIVSGDLGQPIVVRLIGTGVDAEPPPQ